MGLSISYSFRVFFVLLSYGPVVCQSFWSFAPSEQTTATRHGTEERLTTSSHSHVCESRLEVQKLLQLESEVISFCRLIIEQDELLHRAEGSHHDSEHIKRFLTETQRINDVTLSSADVIERHPVLVFRLKRRIKRSWTPILKEIEECELISNSLQTSIGHRFTELSVVLLHESDPQSAINDILFLQRFHCLPSGRLAAGCIHHACVEPLTLDEVNEIAQSAVDQEDYKLALDWVETRLSPSCGQNCPDSTLEDQQNIMTIRASALLMERRFEDAKKAYQELYLRSNSSSLAIASILRTIEARQQKKNEGGAEAEKNDEMSGGKNKTVFQCDSSPCNTMQTRHDELSLTCYSLNSSTTMDGTINVEILNRDPKVVLIHDFLRQNQVNVLQRTAKQMDSEILGSTFAPAVHRIRLTTDDQWMDVIGSQYVNMTYSQASDGVEVYKEAFHVTVKSIGFGQKNSLTSMESETSSNAIIGAQVGQFHVFLNEPEFGGCLVFPKLKVKVQPKQGAAVFWQFRRPSSRRVHDEVFRDLLECPILLGSQWVAKIPLLHPGLGILNF